MHVSNKNKDASPWKRILLSVSVCLLAFLGMAAMTAAVANLTGDPTKALFLSAFPTFLLAGGLSGWILKKRENGRNESLLGALSFLLLLFGCGWLCGGVKPIFYMYISGYLLAFYVGFLLGKKRVKRHTRAHFA